MHLHEVTNQRLMIGPTQESSFSDANRAKYNKFKNDRPRDVGTLRHV